MTKQKLPKWFNGILYTKGNSVTNPFSGDSFKLSAEELSMYDLIKGSEYLLDVRGYDKDIITIMQKSLKWFKNNNNKAYMVLLD